MNNRIQNNYKINIYERYLDLKNSGKTIDQIDNNDLWKIFEYLSCIKLTKEYGTQFYEYDDIDPTFKEANKMSRNDTGIDACNLTDTIVQCKLRKNTLTWRDCSTFFGSQNMYCKEQKRAIVRWNNLIITRNNECNLSENLMERSELFIDKTFTRNVIINYCENLVKNPPKYSIVTNNEFKLRDYQIECINLIKNTKKNIIISLPTGTGKNIIIIHSMEDDKKYLILVPRIILMEQLKEEIIKDKPQLKNKIQVIGNNNNKFDKNKNITICVFNSVGIIEKESNIFERIFVDEAHHINIPEIYTIDNSNNEDIENELSEDLEDNLEEELIESIEEIKDDQEDLEDDPEDELKETTKYTKIIKNLSKLNNNIYLSATIDQTDNFEYYKKDIRDMIDKKYLCDYTIHIPIFSDSPTNKNVCEYLLKNYRNLIIYCNSQKEGKQLNNLLNNLQKGCSEYIDCRTGKKTRDNIVKKYKEGKISFLVNVRILVEGFDAPITKGVYFIHLPCSGTKLIQIIGRALRLHPLKTIANIILPFSIKEDEKNINNFLKIIARNDDRIKKSYENKTIGGYISIEKTIETEIEESDIEEKSDIELRYEMIYNSMGILQNNKRIWLDKLEQVKQYIDKNESRPSTIDKNKEYKTLGNWISTQQTNYKKKSKSMSNKEIYNIWEDFINSEKYKTYFISNTEEWKSKLEQVKQYIDKNNGRPSTHNKNEYKTLGNWINTQQTNYKKKSKSMSNKEIYNIWEDFINSEKYKTYFISNTEEWKSKLEQVKQYIDKNKTRPSKHNKNKEYKTLGSWISAQQENYKKKLQIMSNKEIYNMWENFINSEKYKIYFISNTEEWKSKLEQVKQYIDKNKTRPSQYDKNKEYKALGEWIGHQRKNYAKKSYVMSNKEIYNIWENFINSEKYKTYFISNTEGWKSKLEQVKQYIDKNNSKPSTYNKNEEYKKLAKWIGHQQTNYKKKSESMSNKEIYNIWENFINSEKYKTYFISNTEEWKNKLEQVKQYIDKNESRPQNNAKNEEYKKLATWISHQQQNYKKKSESMSNKEIYNIWENFINSEKYKTYFTKKMINNLNIPIQKSSSIIVRGKKQRINNNL